MGFAAFLGPSWVMVILGKTDSREHHVAKIAFFELIERQEKIIDSGFEEQLTCEKNERKSMILASKCENTKQNYGF